MIVNRLQEVDPVDHLAVRDQVDLVPQARRQRLDQLLVLILRDKCHHIGLNVLLDLLAGFERDLGLPGQFRQTLHPVLDRLLDLTAACEDRAEVTNDE